MRGRSLLLAFGLLGLAACHKDIAAPPPPCTDGAVAITALDTVDGDVVAVSVPAQLDPCGTAPANNTAQTTGTDTPGPATLP